MVVTEGAVKTCKVIRTLKVNPTSLGVHCMCAREVMEGRPDVTKFLVRNVPSKETSKSIRFIILKLKMATT